MDGDSVLDAAAGITFHTMSVKVTFMLARRCVRLSQASSVQHDEAAKSVEEGRKESAQAATHTTVRQIRLVPNKWINKSNTS